MVWRVGGAVPPGYGPRCVGGAEERKVFQLQFAVIHFSDTKLEEMETDKAGGATDNEVCACDCHVM